MVKLAFLRFGIVTYTCDNSITINELIDLDIIFQLFIYLFNRHLRNIELFTKIQLKEFKTNLKKNFF